MEETLTQLREKFSEDLFVVQGIGATIEEASYGYAKCSMDISAKHCNCLGAVMGGAIFTLADHAFAVASNQQGREVVTQASQITFLSTVKGKRLTAIARQVKDGHKICFYEIAISDELGTDVAFMTVNGYVTKERS